MLACDKFLRLGVCWRKKRSFLLFSSDLVFQKWGRRSERKIFSSRILYVQRLNRRIVAYQMEKARSDDLIVALERTARKIFSSRISGSNFRAAWSDRTFLFFRWSFLSPASVSSLVPWPLQSPAPHQRLSNGSCLHQTRPMPSLRTRSTLWWTPTRQLFWRNTLGPCSTWKRSFRRQAHEKPLWLGCGRHFLWTQARPTT